MELLSRQFRSQIPVILNYTAALVYHNPHKPKPGLCKKHTVQLHSSCTTAVRYNQPTKSKRTMQKTTSTCLNSAPTSHKAAVMPITTVHTILVPSNGTSAHRDGFCEF